jgi:dienelactone hydrolase
MAQRITRHVPPARGAVSRVAVRDRRGAGYGLTGLLGLQVLVGIQLVTLGLTSDVSMPGRVVGAVLALGGTGALMLSTASPRMAVRGTALLVGGVLGVSVGAAIAPVHLATTGPSVEVAAGGAALVAGVVLLVVGGWTLVRATPGWWRVLAIPVAFLVLQFGLLPLAGAVYGTHPPRTPTSVAPPADASVATFVTPDGVTMVGWYRASRNGAAVIVLPGSGGEKGSVAAHANVLARHGYGVLSLDSRGTGDSGGVGNAWGWHGTDDIAGALSWLAARPGVSPGRIAVLGLSMGGEEALTAAARDARIGAVIAEGASARVAEDLNYLPWDVSGIIQRIDAWLMYEVAALMTEAPRPIRLVDSVTAAAARVPVLLVVGNDAAEVAAARGFVAAAPALEVWRLPDTPHIQSLPTHPREWEARVVGFLARAIGVD